LLDAGVIVRTSACEEQAAFLGDFVRYGADQADPSSWQSVARAG
jgi:hypothetical protein